MRVAKSQIYTRASSIPTLRFEDQELTSYAGIVVFQKLFAKLNFKERIRKACAHLGERNLYRPAVIVQVLIAHLLLGFRKLRDVEFYQDDPLVQRVLGLKIMPSVSTVSRTLMAFDDRAVEAHHDLNRGMVIERLQRVGLRRITLDFDGSVSSTAKHAEGSAVGFNKQKKGARSYYPLYCTVAQRPVKSLTCCIVPATCMIREAPPRLCANAWSGFAALCLEFLSRFAWTAPFSAMRWSNCCRALRWSLRSRYPLSVSRN